MLPGAHGSRGALRSSLAPGSEQGGGRGPGGSRAGADLLLAEAAGRHLGTGEISPHAGARRAACCRPASPAVEAGCDAPGRAAAALRAWRWCPQEPKARLGLGRAGPAAGTAQRTTTAPDLPPGLDGTGGGLGFLVFHNRPQGGVSRPAPPREPAARSGPPPRPPPPVAAGRRKDK